MIRCKDGSFLNPGRVTNIFVYAKNSLWEVRAVRTDEQEIPYIIADNLTHDESVKVMNEISRAYCLADFYNRSWK